MDDPFGKTLSGGKFDEVFTEVTHSKTLGFNNSERLRLFHLNVNNNTFLSDGLEVLLRKNIDQYVFLRTKIEDYRIEGDAFSAGMNALDIMRKTALPGSEVPTMI